MVNIRMERAIAFKLLIVTILVPVKIGHVTSASISSCQGNLYLNDDGICCNPCPPGYKVGRDCHDNPDDTYCVRCPDGYYSDSWTNRKSCKRLNLCNRLNEEIRTHSNGTTNNKCRCKKGYHYTWSKEICLANPLCPPGQGIERGQCILCMEGTYSDTNSTVDRCEEQPNCNFLGLQVMKQGDTSTKTECGNETQVTSPPSISDDMDYINTSYINNTNYRELEHIGNSSTVHSSTGSGNVEWLWLLLIFPVIGVVIVPCYIYRRKKNKPTSDNVINDLSVDAIRYVPPSVQQDFGTSEEEIPMMSQSSTTCDLPTQHSGSLTTVPTVDTTNSLDESGCLGMSNNHIELLRRNKPKLIEDLQTQQMLDHMTGIFTTEDESNIMNHMVSDHDQRRRFIGILIQKGPQAYQVFITVLAEVTPHLATLFEQC
ncbi:tumor necrosis factor receptor superfamily member 1B-like [Glandiceps talaboti]